MEAFKDYFRVKKNLFNLLLLGILILALPLGVNLVRTQQIINSRAVGEPVVFTGANVVTRNGQLIALAPQVSVRLTSRMGPTSPVMNNQTGSVDNNAGQGAPMSFLPQGLVKIAYAGHDDGCGATDSCPTSQYCDGTGLFSDNADGTHSWIENCADRGSGWTCTNGECTQSGGQCNPNGGIDPNTWSYEGIFCDPGNPGNKGERWNCQGTKKFANDVKDTVMCPLSCNPNGGIDPNTWSYEGIFCDPGNPGNKGERWNCQGTKKFANDVKDTVMCPLNVSPSPSAGVAPSCNSSAVSMIVNPNPGTVGSPMKFSVSGSQGSTYPSDTWSGGVDCSGSFWGDKTCNATSATTTGVWTHAWKNCAPNNCAITSAPCSKTQNYTVNTTGTGGSNDKSGSGTACNVNTPYLGNEGLYALWNNVCNSDNTQGGGIGIGQGCCELACKADPACDEQFAGQGNCDANCKTPTSGKDISGPGTACNVNTPYNAANKNLYDLWDGKCNGSLQAAGSGIGQGCCELACKADSACDEQFAGQGNCNANCKTPTTSAPPSIRPGSSPSIPPSGSPRSSPSYPPALSVFTTQIRYAENAADLSGAVWQGYYDNMIVPYTFKDITPGTKTIFVEFKDSNGKTGGCGPNNSQPCPASIKLVGSSPVISRCSVSFEGGNTVLNLTGTDFGTTNGTVKSDATPLSVRQWKNTSVTAVWQNAPSGQILPVLLINSEGQEAEGQCSASSMLSFGAKYICRAASSQGIDNVDLTLIGKFEGGKKVKQKVKVDAQGIISGITEKLEDGKQYMLSIKAPRSLKKNSALFTAGGGITNIANFVLPVGDIFPADEVDGTINSLDKAELNRQWIIAVVSAGRSGDFNVDGRVNSIDWACMRYGFGRVDDPEEEPGAPPAPSASPNPSASASPSTSGSPGASASPGPEVSASPSTSASPNPSPTDSDTSPSPSVSSTENPWPTQSSGGWRPGWW